MGFRPELLELIGSYIIEIGDSSYDFRFVAKKE